MSAHCIRITIDRQEREIAPGLTMGSVLIGLANLTSHEQLLLEIRDELDIPVAPGDGLLLQGGEAFSIGKGEPPIEDNPCLRHPIHIHFNGHPVPPEEAFHHAKVTGAQLKGLDPNQQPGDALYADLEGLADELIPDTLRIILQKKERFITVPCGNVGEEGLILKHLAEVQAIFSQAHLVEGGGNQYLVVPNFPLPSHWPTPVTTLLVLLPNGYPMAAPDMFWVDPSIHLADGRVPVGTSPESHLGQQWQRFSWHYTHGQAAWRVGESSLLTHLRFCQTRLGQVA